MPLNAHQKSHSSKPSYIIGHYLNSKLQTFIVATFGDMVKNNNKCRKGGFYFKTFHVHNHAHPHTSTKSTSTLHAKNLKHGLC